MGPQVGGSVPSPGTQRDRARQKNRLVRSIAQSQLLTSGAVLLLISIAAVVAPESMERPVLFLGLVLIFVTTGLSVLVPWDTENKQWSVALPIADIIAIVAIREGAPQLGAGLFLVFPVIWMSRNYGMFGVVASVTLSTLALWLGWSFRGLTLEATDFAGLALLPLTLAFIATTTYSTARRTTGQRELLRQQAAVTEEAFGRARAQELYLEEILNAVEFGVVAFNQAGSVTLLNDAHRRSLTDFGVPHSALVHTTGYQSDRVTPFAPESRPLARALRGQSFENLTLWVGEPGARRVAFSVTARGLHTPNGEPDGGVVVLRDVTAELDAIQARDDLIASVSHELRTPLTSILGYLELALDDEGIDPGTRTMVAIAHRNSERLLTLVADLLLAASDADARLPLTFETCDISAIVVEALNDGRAAANASGIEIRGEIPGPVRTTADPLRIRQVIDNLLSNAIKYNSERGTVTIRVVSDAAKILVRVIDTGVGLSEQEQIHLFDRFYRTDSARRSKIHGSGLGIGIARDIVRQHGGDISVTSKTGVGTEFTITLPAVRETAPPQTATVQAG